MLFIPKNKEGEGIFKLFLTKHTYKLINIFSEIKLNENSGIFKLLQKKLQKLF